MFLWSQEGLGLTYGLEVVEDARTRPETDVLFGLLGPDGLLEQVLCHDQLREDHMIQIKPQEAVEIRSDLEGGPLDQKLLRQLEEHLNCGIRVRGIRTHTRLEDVDLLEGVHRQFVIYDRDRVHARHHSTPSIGTGESHLRTQTTLGIEQMRENVRRNVIFTRTTGLHQRCIQRENLVHDLVVQSTARLLGVHDTIELALQGIAIPLFLGQLFTQFITTTRQLRILLIEGVDDSMKLFLSLGTVPSKVTQIMHCLLVPPVPRCPRTTRLGFELLQLLELLVQYRQTFLQRSDHGFLALSHE
ncbi:MAG: hypothetical protein UT32_C0018G0011 [Parcubacteria group bacterium GW2011_GWC2_39_14]|nr:MAG: hypothetical protein UT32_C0018G0011 [Parcubacteria group bacterium GW2011_GWC2_39_14]KKR54718.1 MAG: hypothetical protein UT91_C0010G0011 [Parcubacteria group bacterium GW2011_GWA2_40_23]